MDNCNKKRKFNEDDELWNDFEITEEEFDLALTQAVKVESTPVAIPNEEEKFARAGEIQILRKNLDVISKSLDKERLERETLIASRLADAQNKQKQLQVLIDKLQSEVRFKDQDLTNTQIKYQSLKNQLDKSRQQPSTSKNQSVESSQRGVISSPALVVRNSNKVLKTFPQNIAFESAPKCVTAETQTEQTSEKRCFSRNYELSQSLSIKSDCSFSSSVLVSSSMFDNEIKVQPFSVFLEERGSNSSNLQNLCCCFEEENLKLNHKAETDFFSKVTTALSKYFDVINQHLGVESQSTPIYASDMDGNTPETIQSTSSFFKPYTSPGKDQGSWQHLKLHTIQNLISLRNLLAVSSAGRNFFFRSLNLEVFLKSKLSQTSSSTSSKEDIPVKMKTQQSLTSLLLFALTPIFFECKVINQDIVNWTLKMLNVVIAPSSPCCFKPIGPILRSLCLSTFFDGSCGADTPFLVLNLLYSCNSLDAIDFLFERHKDFCTLTSIAKSIKLFKTLCFEQQESYFLLLTDFFSHILNDKRNIYGNNCHCFAIFMDNYLKWLTHFVNNEQTHIAILEKSLKLLILIFYNVGHHKEVSVIGTKYILLTTYLSQTVSEKFPNSQLSKLLAKLNYFETKLTHDDVKCDSMDIL